MSECAQIVGALKRSLKARGITYRVLAKAVGVSEASIKRIFAEKTFSLVRLEQICAALGMSIVEVARMAAEHGGADSQQLSLEQEEILASDSRLLACFHLLLNGRQSAEIAVELRLQERELRKLLVKLDAAKLIELQAKLKVRLRTSNVISWLSNGPVRRLYEQQVKTEFLQADFNGRTELLDFVSAELSEESSRILIRKAEMLARDFAELTALDAAVTVKDKRCMGLLVAFRPWVFSTYDGLRRDS